MIVIDMTIDDKIMRVTDRTVRAGVRHTLERVGDERDPLGLQPVTAIDQRIDRDDPFEALVQAVLPVMPTSGTASQVVRNAAARRAFLAEFPTWTSAEVARSVGSTAKNAAALATRWRKERRIFAVPWGGELRYPVFQFDDAGRPLPIVRSVLDVFAGRDSSEWQIALWFVAPSPYLPREAPPIGFLADEGRLLAAARAEQDVPEF